MYDKLLFAILLGTAGFREMLRQYKALARIRVSGARHRWDVWGHCCASGFGLGTFLVGAGQLWPMFSAPGWFLAGLGGALSLPVPCGIPLVNDWRSLKLARNIFLTLVGMSFIAHSFGLL